MGIAYNVYGSGGRLMNEFRSLEQAREIKKKYDEDFNFAGFKAVIKTIHYSLLPNPGGKPFVVGDYTVGKTVEA